MPEMTGADAMFEMLVRAGVRHVFGNPGTTELPLMDLFAARDEISYILALHEDSAVGIAMGYAEASASAAVVNLHTAPGLAHGLKPLQRQPGRYSLDSDRRPARHSCDDRRAAAVRQYGRYRATVYKVGVGGP